MPIILLLDLDDTLLQNSMDSFVPAYLQALAAHLSPKISPDHLIQELLRATQIMLSNDRPDRTLKETFDSIFFPALGIPQEQIQAEIDEFYQTKFPELAPLTQPMPGGTHLVKTALSRGYDLILATNPLFPRLAILHRMDWAGLEHDKDSFKIIPSYETFHFAKPNPAYFAELLARNGWKESPVLMIGDDLHNDIYPARKAGIQSYWITAEGDNQDSPKGKLSQFLGWLDQVELSHLQMDFSTPQAILAVLKSTPAALPYLCEKIKSEDWNTRYQPSEWCQTEIICHLRDVEREINLPRLQKSIRETNPFIPGVDSDQWADQRGYRQQSGSLALKSFIEARLELIAILENFQPDDWLRQIRHAIFGPTSLLELVGFIAEHDRIHIRQIVQNAEPSHPE